MIIWLKLTKKQNFGLFAFGFVLFFLQELPYLIMPLIPLSTNPLMEMQDKSALLNIAEKSLGISCIIVMLFLVQSDAKWFSIKSTRELTFFLTAISALIGYYIGWILYFNGIQNLPLILCTLVALPPLYYTSIGLWRRNNVLAILGPLFLLTHITNVWNNLK